MADDREWERYLFSDAPHDPLEAMGAAGASHTPGGSFCNAGNVEGCSLYMDQTLTSLGYSPMQVVQAVASKDDAVRILNVANALVELYRDAQRRRHDDEHRAQRAINDLSDCSLKLEQAKEEMNRLSRALATASEERRQLAVKKAQLEEENQCMKEELRRTKVLSQQKAEQYNHENKKREREHTKLKDRLQKLLSDKSKEQRMGMELVKALQRPDGKRGTWNKGAAEDMQRTLVLHYETLQKQVMKENTELRASLAAMQRELVEVLQHAASGSDLNSSLSETYLSASGGVHTGGAPGTKSAASPLSDAHFALPYDLGRDYIEESMRGRFAALRGQVTWLKRCASTSDATEEVGVRAALADVVDNLPGPPAPPVFALPLPARGSGVEDGLEEVARVTTPEMVMSHPRSRLHTESSCSVGDISSPSRASRPSSLLSPSKDLLPSAGEDVFS